jgi:hypothetical protein
MIDDSESGRKKSWQASRAEREQIQIRFDGWFDVRLQSSLLCTMVDFAWLTDQVYVLCGRIVGPMGQFTYWTREAREPHLPSFIYHVVVDPC